MYKEKLTLEYSITLAEKIVDSDGLWLVEKLVNADDYDAYSAYHHANRQDELSLAADAKDLINKAKATCNDSSKIIDIVAKGIYNTTPDYNLRQSMTQRILTSITLGLIKLTNPPLNVTNMRNKVDNPTVRDLLHEYPWLNIDDFVDLNNFIDKHFGESDFDSFLLDVSEFPKSSIDWLDEKLLANLPQAESGEIHQPILPTLLLMIAALNYHISVAEWGNAGWDGKLYLIHKAPLQMVKHHMPIEIKYAYDKVDFKEII